MIDEQFLQTIPQYGIGGFVGGIFKKVKKAVKKVAEPAGAALGFMIAGPAGASLGAGIGSLIAGKKPENALKSALMAYGIGNLAGSGFFGKTIQGFGGKGIPTFGLTDGNLLSGIGSKGQILPTDLASNLFGSSDKLVAEKDLGFEAWAKSNNIDLTNPNLDLDLVKSNYTKDILNAGTKSKGFGFNLGTAATAGSIGLPIASYMAAKNAQENFVPGDPNALNALYYENPEEFQIANQGVSPYYYTNLQDQYGVPIEDLPTDFYRPITAAEGGIIQLADGSEKYFPRKNGQIDGPGTGTSDDIPAMLSDGEFVFTAKAVRNAGDGDRREGAKRMYQVMKNLEKGGNLSTETRGVA